MLLATPHPIVAKQLTHTVVFVGWVWTEGLWICSCQLQRRRADWPREQSSASAARHRQQQTPWTAAKGKTGVRRHVRQTGKDRRSEGEIVCSDVFTDLAPHMAEFALFFNVIIKLTCSSWLCCVPTAAAAVRLICTLHTSALIVCMNYSCVVSRGLLTSFM